jgi:hypothetical protein
MTPAAKNAMSISQHRRLEVSSSEYLLCPLLIALLCGIPRDLEELLLSSGEAIGIVTLHVDETQ